MDFTFALDADNQLYIQTNLTGYALLANPLLNKGMAFTQAERLEFGLLGLIPPYETHLTIQVARSYETYLSKPSDLEKYIYLRDLQDSNETLFYRLVTNYIAELMPIVYTPVVGLGCQRFSHIYRRPRGIYISYPDIDNIDAILSHPRFNRVRVIVVSDGERILGLGDQGAGGMGIPIGKLALYTACAGIHPSATLPILLDTGTNNPDLLEDPLYIGWHHERIRGKEYDVFLEKCVTAIKKRFPHVLLQWEDFAQQNANPILERYRDQLCTFNDDIQGTAAVATGTLFAAINVTGIPIKNQRILVVGAGSAGCGISNLIVHAMMEEGLTQEAARQNIYLMDKQGLITTDTPNLLVFQQPYAKKPDAYSHLSLQEMVKHIKPTLLIGVSGQPGIFTEEVVREMALHVDRPVIFPLSNPTIRSEATPDDLMRWTNERAIIGTGSPFGNITRDGKSFRVDQTNNCYIFPGVGLGLIAVNATAVTDKMFMIAAKALAACSPALLHPDANLLPPLTDIRTVSLHVAIAIAKEAIREKIGTFPDDKDLAKHIEEMMWIPDYVPYHKA